MQFKRMHGHDVWVPDHLEELVDSLQYRPGWSTGLDVDFDDDLSGGLVFYVISVGVNSMDFDRKVAVRHNFLVPNASYNRDTWAAWLFDRMVDVERHEAGEFFRIDGVREFAPHHSNGEDPYRTYHVSDWATANKSAGED